MHEEEKNLLKNKNKILNEELTSVTTNYSNKIKELTNINAKSIKEKSKI